MDLSQFLLHIHDGAYDVFRTLLQYLTNPELKALRLSIKPISRHLFPCMFRRVYFSAYPEDLYALQKVLHHRSACQYIEELVVDDTVFDDIPMHDVSCYRNLLTAKSPHLQLRHDYHELSELAYVFWVRRRKEVESYKYSCRDILYLKEALTSFAKLKQVSILGRMHGSRFGSILYWNEWQTPRQRAWSRLRFSEFLVPPISHKPLASAVVDENSEGLRPMRLLCACLDYQKGFNIRSLRLSSIMNTASIRRRRAAQQISSKRPYIPDLLKYRDEDLAGCLNVLLDVPFFIMSQHGKFWNAVIDECMARASETLEELTLAFVDLEGYWNYLEAVSMAATISGADGGALKSCKKLRKLRFEHCASTRDPFPLFEFLYKHTSVQEIELHECSSEAVPWIAVLNEMKSEDVIFDSLELRSCSCVMDNWAFLGIDLNDNPAAPWHGSKEAIRAWLRSESAQIPLWQGPG